MPNYFDVKERLPIPDTSNIDRIRFLTTVDFPPFSFLDQTGRLSGFHVDLAREICAELKVLERCQIQALEWAELQPALLENQGDAIIAGLSITQEMRSKFSFTRRYLELPARFAVQKDSKHELEIFKNNADLKVGVIKETAHEAMLKSWYPGLKVEPLDDRSKLFEALETKKVDAIFGDGMQISFWLSGKSSKDCCKFLGGAHLSVDFLGEGLSIAVDKEDRSLAATLNYGLSLLAKNGRFKELYLKYFPNGIY